MGNQESKVNFRKAVIDLTTTRKSVEPGDTPFWEQFWSPNNVASAQDIFSLIPSTEIRALREDAPNNLATLCYKTVERLVDACDHVCTQPNEHKIVINCVRLLTRLLPYIFEDADWRGYFWSALPADRPTEENDTRERVTDEPLAVTMLNALCDLLFCPDFTVTPTRRGPETVEALSSLDSCEYIWEAGVGFAQSPPQSAAHDANRTEILKLLLTCCSEVIYIQPAADGTPHYHNRWIEHLTSAANRHVLPLFTSLLNVLMAYDPVGTLPYNHIWTTDARQPLVHACLQLLIVCLDQQSLMSSPRKSVETLDAGYADNFFINYLSRIHRDEDFEFMLRGFVRLLNNPLTSSYLPNSFRRVHCHQELLVLFWKCAEYNKKFLYHVLKTSDVLEILVPILYHLNDARNDQCEQRWGLLSL